MLGRLGNIAAECVKHPSHKSVWSEAEGRYVCPDALLERAAGAAAIPRGRAVPAAAHTVASADAPGINPMFKLVFLTAAGGTLLFTLICVGLHLATDGNPPPLMDKFIQGLFDLAKIGFGAIVGLLGGKALDSPAKPQPS